MSNKIATCLWFDTQGEEAARLYTSLIPGSAITNIFRPSPDAPPMMVTFHLAGVPYQALNGGPMYPQTEAASIAVRTEDQAETDHLWNTLTADRGKVRLGFVWRTPSRLAMISRSALKTVISSG